MSEEYSLVPYSFCREIYDCVDSIYCLCINCRSNLEQIIKYRPIFPKPSRTGIDDQPATEPGSNMEDTYEITHFKIVMEEPKYKRKIICWKTPDDEIAFEKGIWKYE